MQHQTTHTGFTIVELLVVLGIVALLAALLMPSLSKSREQSRVVVCLSNLSNNYRNVLAYELDEDEVMPYYTSRYYDPLNLHKQPPDGLHKIDLYLGVAQLWYVPMLDVYGSNPYNDALFCPSNLKKRDMVIEMIRARGHDPYSYVANIDYSMSDACYLDSKALDPLNPRPDMVEYYRPQHFYEIVFPSQKALIFENKGFHTQSMRTTGMDWVPHSVTSCFGDGSAAFVDTRDITPAVVLYPTGNQARDDLNAETFKLSRTPYGIRGRDR